ncbi:hypothetical protein BV20DRAFT_842114 [Pilatotrama ljubarskyi]|nr:hypothetical protein BV20DRAFT_842114 [Pilatotrama ljubarskyi]
MYPNPRPFFSPSASRTQQRLQLLAYRAVNYPTSLRDHVLLPTLRRPPGSHSLRRVSPPLRRVSLYVRRVVLPLLPRKRIASTALRENASKDTPRRVSLAVPERRLQGVRPRTGRDIQPLVCAKIDFHYDRASTLFASAHLGASPPRPRQVQTLRALATHFVLRTPPGQWRSHRVRMTICPLRRFQDQSCADSLGTVCIGEGARLRPGVLQDDRRCLSYLTEPT